MTDPAGSQRRPGRGWTAFSLIGVGLWVGVTVLVAVLSDDPTDPGPTLIAFAASGTVFFGLMFGAALWVQLRQRAPDSAARSKLRIARIYTGLGILVTGLGLATIWQQALGGGNARVFLIPLAVIVFVWAATVPWTLRRVSSGAPGAGARRDAG